MQIAEQRPATVSVNDVHSKLNPTVVAQLLEPTCERHVQQAVRRAAERGLPLVPCGGRHAMGGQQFATGGILVDMGRMDRVLEFDPVEGTITVEAGAQWQGLQAAYLERQRGLDQPWGFRQKQTGADRLSLGGALAANIHGRVLDRPPFVEDVISFRMVDARGRLLTCSRQEHPELFSLVIGGYGLFGVVTAVTLQLVPREKLERVVALAQVEEVMGLLEDRIREGCSYGDFQFAIDPASEDFLRRGVLSCYRPVDPDTPIPGGQRYMTESAWLDLLHDAHVEKSRAFEKFAAFYLATSGQIYWSDTHQFSRYLDDYHEALDHRLCSVHRGTEMITELYVPRPALVDFLGRARAALRQHEADLVYGTVRLIREDRDSFLAWAREDFACVIFNLHVTHTPAGNERAGHAFRALIDAALEESGSYFLTYHRHATAEQLTTAHPRIREFMDLKKRHDPDGRFASDWYRHQLALLEKPG